MTHSPHHSGLPITTSHCRRSNICPGGPASPDQQLSLELSTRAAQSQAAPCGYCQPVFLLSSRPSLPCTLAVAVLQPASAVVAALVSATSVCAFVVAALYTRFSSVTVSPRRRRHHRIPTDIYAPETVLRRSRHSLQARSTLKRAIPLTQKRNASRTISHAFTKTSTLTP
jgi:hypothetical protein